MATAEQVDRMLYNFFTTRLNVLLAFQHDPDNPLYVLHDHPISAHLEPIEQNKQINAEIRKALMERTLQPAEAELIDAVFTQQQAWRSQLEDRKSTRLNSS